MIEVKQKTTTYTILCTGYIKEKLEAPFITDTVVL